MVMYCTDENGMLDAMAEAIVVVAAMTLQTTMEAIMWAQRFTCVTLSTESMPMSGAWQRMRPPDIATSTVALGVTRQRV